MYNLICKFFRAGKPFNTEQNLQ